MGEKENVCGVDIGCRCGLPRLPGRRKLVARFARGWQRNERGFVKVMFSTVTENSLGDRIRGEANAPRHA